MNPDQNISSRPVFILGLIILLATSAFGNTIFIIAGGPPVSWSAINTGSGPGGQPFLTDNIIIGNNAVLLVDVPGAICASIHVGSAAPPAVGPGALQLPFPFSHLTVNGLVTLGDGPMPGALIMGPGYLACKGITVNNLLPSSPGGTIEFTASYIILASMASFGNLIISGGTTQLSATTVVSGDLTIGSGATLSTDQYDLSVSGATSVSGAMNIDGIAGLRTFTGDVTINSGGNWSDVMTNVVMEGSFTNNGSDMGPNGGLWTFTGASKTFGGSGSIQLGRVRITGSYTNYGHFWLYDSVSGQGSLTQGPSANLYLVGPISDSLALVATANGNSVLYYGTDTQRVKGIEYYNIQFITSGVTKILEGPITVDGALLINPGAILSTGAGNYPIVMKGDNWMNNGTFSPGTGRVTFNGSGVQYLNGNNPTTFYNLTINNSNGIKVVNSADIIIGDSLTLTSGLLNLGEHTLTLNGQPIAGTPDSLNGDSTSSIVIGGSAQGFSLPARITALKGLTINNPHGLTLGANLAADNLDLTSGNLLTGSHALTMKAGCTLNGGSSSAYVDGTLSHLFSGAETFTYPVGDTGYAPVTCISGGSGTVDIGTVYGFPAGVTDTAHALHRSWNITSSVSACDLIFHYPAGDVRGTETNYEGGKNTGAGWNTVPGFPDHAGHADTLKSAGPGTFGFTMGEPDALPIEIFSVWGSAASCNTVSLRWSTMSENTLLGFFVQRSAEISGSFVIVGGLIPAAGTSLTCQTYAYIDSQAAAGTYYYRVEQVNTDNSIYFTEPIKIVVSGALGVREEKSQVFQLDQNYPNPFNPATDVGYRVADFGLITLTVFDQLGRAVATPVNEWKAPGEYRVSFDASRLTSGIYYYRLNATNSSDPTKHFSLVKKMILMK